MVQGGSLVQGGSAIRVMTRSRCCRYCCEKTENSEFSVDLGNHGRLHTKWIDYCFRAELEFPERLCSGSLAGMNNVFCQSTQRYHHAMGNTETHGLGAKFIKKKREKME